jgi:O-antigen/teichoic acid export membrane protein
MTKRSYLGNIAKLAGGVAVGQGIAILASPVLTRLYEPSEFGVLAVYTAIVGIIGAMASLSYHQAIPLPENDGDAANIFGLSLFIIVATFLVSSIAIFIVGKQVVDQLGVPELAAYLWLIPLGILGLSTYETVTQWAIRQKSFPVIARTSAAKGIVQSGTQLIAGFAGAGPIGLLLGQLFGQWTGAVRLLRNALRKSGAAFRGVTLAGAKEASQNYFKFLRFTSPSIVFNVAGRDSPPLILAYFFGSSVAGMFALGERVLMIPVTLIAKSASQVFVSSAAQFHREGRLAIEVEHLFDRMLRLALAPVVILGISAPALFSFVFGEQWTEAGHYVRWLSAWLLFVFISRALTPVVFVLERQRVGMWFQGLLATGRIATLVAGGLIGDARLSVAMFGVVSSLMWAVYLVWLLEVSCVSITRAGRAAASTLFVSLLFVLPTIGCKVFGVTDIITVGVVIVSGSSAVVWSLMSVNR